MKKRIIIVQLVVVVILSLLCIKPLYDFFNRYEVVVNKNEDINKKYHIAMINNNADNSIGYSIYSGSKISNSYQNKYFIEYDSTENADENTISVKEKTVFDGKVNKLPKPLKVTSLKVRIKNAKNKTIYQTSDLCKNKLIKKSCDNKNLILKDMYLTENNEKDLLLNIPLGKSYLSFKEVLQYNFNTKKVTKVTVSNKVYGLFVGVLVDLGKDKRLDLLVKKIEIDSKNTSKNNPSNNYKTFIIENGKDYYEAYPNSQLFKEFPELKKYFNENHKDKQIILNFKKSMSDEEIIKILK